MGKVVTDPVVVGIDVGSTTVKAVVLDPTSLDVLWCDYQRHQTKQPEKVLEFIERIEAEFPQSPRDKWRVFMHKAYSSRSSIAMAVKKAKPRTIVRGFRTT